MSFIFIPSEIGAKFHDCGKSLNKKWKALPLLPLLPLLLQLVVCFTHWVLIVQARVQMTQERQESKDIVCCSSFFIVDFEQIFL